VPAHRPAPIVHRVGQSMPGQLDEVRSITLQLGQQRCPNGSGETHPVQRDEVRPRANREDPQTNLGGEQSDEGLVCGEVVAVEERPLGISNALLD
jgi:hypothetical protein